MNTHRVVVVFALILINTLSFGVDFGINDVFREFRKKPYISSEFSQTVYTAAIDKTSKATGKLIYFFPGKSRWDYQIPEIQTIIIDEKEITVVDPVLETVSIRKLKGNVPDNIMFFLSGDEASVKSYKKRKKPLKDVLKCNLEPMYYTALLDDDFIREIHICYDHSTKFFKSVYILEKNGNYRIFSFINANVENVNLQPFKYDIPKKWEIIRD